MKQLFITINNSTGHGLQQEHKMLFTARLAQIRLGEDACEPLFDLFLSNSTLLEPQRLSMSLLSGKLTKSQVV